MVQCKSCKDLKLNKKYHNNEPELTMNLKDAVTKYGTISVKLTDIDKI